MRNGWRRCLGLAITRIPCGHNDCRPYWPGITDEIVRFLLANGVLDPRATPAG